MTKIVQDFEDIMRNYDITKYITRNVLTKYEKTKVIGMRLEQLARGAPTLIDTEKHDCKSIREVVMLELEEKKLPFVIVRSLPNGKQEHWRVCDMIAH